MDDFADLSRRIESMIRFGAIAAVQMAPPRVRVQSGGLTSAWRPWFALRAGDTRDWDPPTPGEQCVLFSPSGDPATGIALVGLYSDSRPAPSNSPDEHVRAYPDGARIAYNHATGALSVAGVKTARIQASDLCTVDCPRAEFTGDVHIQGKLTVDGETLLKALLTYMNGLAGQGGGAGTRISGAIEHSGGGLSSNGVTLHAHVHPDSHGGDTGGPK